MSTMSCSSEWPHDGSQIDSSRATRVLITGVTGFVGQAMLKFLKNNRRMFPNGLEVTGTSLTKRNHERMQDEYEFLRCVEANVLGDLTHLPESDLVFHLASPASAELINNSPAEMFKVLSEGAKNMRDMLHNWASCPRVLLASSGAVYNWSRERSTSAGEDDPTAPETLNPLSCYGEGKRVAEFLLSTGALSGSYQLVVARMFAFGGPGLPLDRHFAIGNFVLDALTSGVIRIEGNPMTVRSYLSSDDMAKWLYVIAVRGQPSSVYHVGSEYPISMIGLAELVADVVERIVGRRVDVLQNPGSAELPRSFYVPNTRKTREELVLDESSSIAEIIEAMVGAAMNSELFPFHD